MVRRLTTVALMCGCVFSFACSGTSDESPPEEAESENEHPETSSDALGEVLPELTDNQIRVIGPAVEDVEPGEDVTLCTYLDWYAETDLKISASAGYQTGESAHHMVAFAVAQNREPGTEGECTDEDMTNALGFVAGGGPDSKPLAIPSGVALTIPAGAQLMVQHHWINPTLEPVNGATAMDLTLYSDDADVEPAALFLQAHTTFNIPAGSTATESTECVIQEPMNVFMLSGHEHEWGSGVTIDIQRAGRTDKERLYDSVDWEEYYMFDPPRNVYPDGEPLVLSPGDVLTTTCSWNNTRSEALTFPAEMCFAVSYFYPAPEGNVSCFDGVWGG